MWLDDGATQKKCQKWAAQKMPEKSFATENDMPLMTVDQGWNEVPRKRSLVSKHHPEIKAKTLCHAYDRESVSASCRHRKSIVECRQRFESEPIPSPMPVGTLAPEPQTKLFQFTRICKS
jgi:hypothetical protein